MGKIFTVFIMGSVILLGCTDEKPRDTKQTSTGEDQVVVDKQTAEKEPVKIENIPTYPNAQKEAGADAFESAIRTYTTKDSYTKVVEYYIGVLGKPESNVTNEEGSNAVWLKGKYSLTVNKNKSNPKEVLICIIQNEYY